MALRTLVPPITPVSTHTPLTQSSPLEHSWLVSHLTSTAAPHSEDSFLLARQLFKSTHPLVLYPFTHSFQSPHCHRALKESSSPESSPLPKSPPPLSSPPFPLSPGGI